MSKRALICGISGQDGAYLADFLLEKGYSVFGTSRDAEMSSFGNLQKLGIRNKIDFLSMTPTDFRSVLSALKHTNPDEIYNLAGQTSVGLSFGQPVETLESITVSTLNLLEAIRFRELPCRFYNAGSSEVYGDTDNGAPANEQTAFRPRSPYGVAKSAAHWIVSNYREAYGLFACSGILFNHESPFRPTRFVTAKIIAGAVAIAAGQQEKLHLGRMDVVRDWGWAPDYVDAMWRILQADEAEDFVIATGKSVSLEDFVAIAFNTVGLDWRDHVVTDDQYARPTDISISRGDPSRAFEKLDWRASKDVEAVIAELIADRQSESS